MISRCAIDQAECIENTQALPQRVKVCSVSGFALLSCGEEPCPLRLQTVFSTPSLIFPESPPCFCLTEMEMLSLWFNFFDFMNEDGMI